MEGFDLVVIGSGPGGYVAAARAGQLGMKTALIEKDPWLGGTCLNRGCIPTKHLLHSAELYHRVSHGEGGISTAGLTLNLEKVQQEKDALLNQLRTGISKLEKARKVKVLHGHGSLEGVDRVRVLGPDEDQVLDAKNILLATGSRVSLPGFIPRHPRIISSDQALELTTIPARILVLGAGAVGIEFSCIFSSWGSQVTLVELMDQIAPGEEPRLARLLERSLKKNLGVQVLTGTRVTDLAPTDQQVAAGWTDPKGREGRGDFDLVLVAVGRAPNTDDLGLEKVGVETRKGLVVVDPYYRTNVPSIRAIGDIVPTPALAHVAHHEAMIAVDSTAGIDTHPLDLTAIPFGIYSTPELARVGLTEAEAQAEGREVSTAQFPFSGIAKGLIEGGGEGAVKLVADKATGELLGMHILGPKATELIMEGVLARTGHLSVDTITHSIHAHPTLSEAVLEAASALSGRPIHG